MVFRKLSFESTELYIQTEYNENEIDIDKTFIKNIR